MKPIMISIVDNLWFCIFVIIFILILAICVGIDIRHFNHYFNKRGK